MPSAPRCRRIKVNGTQCGSPALRNQEFCFYHMYDRPTMPECYSDIEYATGQIALPPFEDAHSIQTVIHQVVQMVLQKRLEQKTASIVLYALQIASSNLKRMEQEKPQPEQVVTDTDLDRWDRPIAIVAETIQKSSPATQRDSTVTQANASSQPDVKEKQNQQIEQGKNNNKEDINDEGFPIGTIQACLDPRPYQHKTRVSHMTAAKSEVVH